MANPQVNTIPSFPRECSRHRFNIENSRLLEKKDLHNFMMRNLVQEDWEEFKDEETKKWQTKILKYFGEDPKI